MTPSSRHPAPLEVEGHHVHFVGIGGCGMSGLARIVQRHGARCSGSDRADSSTVAGLRRDGFHVALQQTADTVPEGCDLLVISAAIPTQHPEVLEAKRRGVTVMKYAELLGRLMIGRRGVAVAGTHGKSSTTSMLSHALIDNGLDPSLIVGANCAQIGGGSRVGESDLLVAEACEYDRSFHNFHPKHAIILNVEEDHLDTYGSLAAIIESFKTFAAQLPKDGSLLIHHECPHRLAITGELDCNVETIGYSPHADWRVRFELRQAERPLVHLSHHEEQVAEWDAPLPGEHMAYNACCAAATAHRLGAPWDGIAKAIAGFTGLDRRMQRLGERHIDAHSDLPVIVVDDYGHHPTEIDVTLRALRRHYRPNRLVCVFQPHQHSRTRFLMKEFAASFSDADLVLVPQIYFVRDSLADKQAVTAADLVDRLRQTGVDALHLYPLDAIAHHLEAVTRGGDLLVTMGAGDVWKVARAFLAGN